MVVIDEAHHFRNPGYAGTGHGLLQAQGDRQPSRYRRLYDLVEGPRGVKHVFLLTATPVNNRLLDIQHMVQLFSRQRPDRFKDLGIHYLPGHIRKMEKDLLKATAGGAAEAAETNLAEAGDVLAGDALFRALIVQRSRSYVRESQRLQGKEAALFPEREPPRVADYDLRKTYGKLLGMVEEAFARDKPLFSLAMYDPSAFVKDDRPADEAFKLVQGRLRQVVALIRTQFLKRFESSAHAFQRSCERLLVKLLAFVMKNSETPAEKHRLERWQLQHKELIGYVHEHQLELFPDEDEADEDLVSEDDLEAVERLDRDKYRVDEILNETILDLDQVAASWPS